mgnify:CR=1 FL=1
MVEVGSDPISNSSAVRPNCCIYAQHTDQPITNAWQQLSKNRANKIRDDVA